MNLRFTLRSPLGDTVVRDTHDGVWSEPVGAADDDVGSDLWALPGLVDAHAHLPAEVLETVPGDLEGAMDRAGAALRAGVTLLLDKGWTDDTTIRLIETMPAEDRPDIEAAARILSTPDGYFPGFGLEVGPGSLEAMAASEARAGRGWLKLIGDWPRRGMGPVVNFDETELRAAVAVAEAAGAKVAIHAMAPETPSLAVAAGVHSIEHGLFLSPEDVSALGRRSGMWVPTLLRAEATLAQLGAESTGGRLFTEGLARLRSMLPIAIEAGVSVLAGTDLVGSPAQVAAEALRLRDYGLTSRQIVESASIAGLVATGRDAGFDPGTPANAVLFPADPVVEPEVLAHPAMVVRLGRVI